MMDLPTPTQSPLAIVYPFLEVGNNIRQGVNSFIVLYKASAYGFARITRIISM